MNLNLMLTTIHQPLREMAEQATRMVLQLVDEAPAVTRIELATRLVERDSTAPPRSRLAD